MRSDPTHSCRSREWGGGGGMRSDPTHSCRSREWGGVWEKLRDDREREFFHKKLTKSEKAVCPGKVFLIFCTCSK